MCSLTLSWRRTREDEVEKTLTQRSQFNSERVGLTEALVRESFQNSLDAEEPGRPGPIRVRIHLVGPSDDSSYFGPILNVLGRHLSACDVDSSGIDLERPTFLVIEDFATTGLTGTWSVKGSDGWNDFFRRFGTSHKSGARGGRWGLGKLVFTSASRIRSFFALTVRSSDTPRLPLLMGQCVLSTHSIDGIEYDSHGFFARPGDHGRFQLPVLDEKAVIEFARRVGVSRKSEPGLSIAIPFPVPEVTRERIIGYLLANYAFPILSGELEVEVDGTAVTASTFGDLVPRYGDELLKSGEQVAFIREIRGRQEKAPDVELASGWSKKFEDGLSAEKLNELQAAFEAGKVVHVRAPIQLRHRENGIRPSYVDAFLQRFDDPDLAASLCVRGLLTVPGEADRFRIRGCLTALVAKHEGVVSFLGDAEGPAHTDWNAREERVQRNWSNASDRLAEIRSVVRRVHAALTASVRRKEQDALIDEFSIARETPLPRDKAKRKAKPPLPPREPAPRPRKFNIVKRDGGFAVTSGDGLAEEDLPLSLRIRVAYDIGRGNPFAKHSRYDFDLLDEDGDIDLEVNGCTVARSTHNAIALEITDRKFRAQLSGFDPNRDLVIDARKAGS